MRNKILQLTKRDYCSLVSDQHTMISNYLVIRLIKDNLFLVYCLYYMDYK